MSGLVKSLFGKGETEFRVNTDDPSGSEQALIQINTQLAREQLKNLEQLAPFQQELLQMSLADLRRQSATSSALDSAITPEQQAEFAKQEFQRAQRLGPIQDELLELQLEQLRSGGAATPEQLKRIKEATDAAISAGSSDIDISTKRGIGLISDELANSRGLRLSDSPIAREAAFLARGGEDQKASLIKNLRSGQASAALNFPLASQQVQSGINLNQQTLGAATRAFQADLRQRAFQNRLALSGQASSSGIGLATVGSGVGASQAATLAGTRGKYGTEFDPAKYLTGVGNFMQGVSSFFSPG